MPQESKNPNDFHPKKSDAGKGKSPRIYTFLKPEMEMRIDEQETQQTQNNDGFALVCRCDKVCTCDTVMTDRTVCRCDTVSKCTCQKVRQCSCDTVVVCSCDKVQPPAQRRCTCDPVRHRCSCDSYSSGGGGRRVCRCVPVAH